MAEEELSCFGLERQAAGRIVHKLNKREYSRIDVEHKCCKYSMLVANHLPVTIMGDCNPSAPHCHPVYFSTDWEEAEATSGSKLGRWPRQVEQILEAAEEAFRRLAQSDKAPRLCSKAFPIEMYSLDPVEEDYSAARMEEVYF